MVSMTAAVNIGSFVCHLAIVGDVSIDNSVMMDMDDIRRLQAHDLSDDSF